MVVSKMAEELSDQINPEDVIKKWSHCSNSYDEEKHIIFPVTRNNESNISTTLLRRKLVASSLKGNRKVCKNFSYYREIFTLQHKNHKVVAQFPVPR